MKQLRAFHCSACRASVSVALQVGGQLDFEDDTQDSNSG
jgi:hypothetical protein